ncbi:unnamed protein product, partial [Chrysoparadoxa australica]
SLSVLLNTNIGWRSSSLLVGSLGVGTAALAGVVLKDPSNTSEAGAAAEVQAKPDVEALSIGESISTVLSSHTVQFLFLASALRFGAGYGIGVWAAPYFREAFPAQAGEYAVLNAFVVAGGGVASSILGGLISDKFADPRVKAWVPMIGSLLAVPLWIAVVTSTDFYTAIAALFLEYLVAECWFGPSVTILQEVLPSNVRGIAQGGFSMLTALGNISPVIIGSLVQGGTPLSDTLAQVVPVFYAGAAVFFFLTGQSLGQFHQGKEKVQ